MNCEFMIASKPLPLRSAQGKHPPDVLHPCVGSASYPFVGLPPANFSESLFHLAS